MSERTSSRSRGSSSTPAASGSRSSWGPAHKEQRVAIVGATGAVGRELLDILFDAGHPAENVETFARRSMELELPRGRRTSVRPLELDANGRDDAARFARWNLVFLCTPSELSLTLAPRLVEAGVRVIDLSSAHRMLPHVPLIVPEINAADLGADRRLIANPNCTTAIAAMPLAVIDREAELEEVIVVSFQAASGAGLAGLQTLERETNRRASEADIGRAVAPPVASPFPSVLALNVIPAVADVGPDGTSGEERKVIDETRRILGRPGLTVEVTTTRVPVERCHSVAVHVKTRRELAPERLRELLASAPGIALTSDEHGPRPRECAGTDPVHVGRIRRGTRGNRSLCFFAVGDQLRKGAALNALQIAALLPAER
jgi:aspartate-semialdehyde dehydrogenase